MFTINCLICGPTLRYHYTPEAAREVIRKLPRKIFYLYMFLADQGLAFEADDFIEKHMGSPAPFEEEW